MFFLLIYSSSFSTAKVQRIPKVTRNRCYAACFFLCHSEKNLYNPATDPELKADNMIILDGAKVRFGNHVFVGPGCGFHTAQHPLNAERRNVGLEWAHPITVGDNVWIGAGVQVLPGVTIGHDSVVGAGSVVMKDVEPYTVVAGNPAKVIRNVVKNPRITFLPSRQSNGVGFPGGR